MVATAEERRGAAQSEVVVAEVIDHHMSWEHPVLPVIAGHRSWPDLEEGEGAITRWKALPGGVALGVWPEWRCDETESTPPDIEVVLPLTTYGDRLAKLVEKGEGTLAVLELTDNGGEDQGAQWIGVPIDTEGLAEAMVRGDHLDRLAQAAGAPE